MPLPLAALLPWLLAAIAAAGTLALMVRQLRRARLIEDIPTSRIRSAAQGTVELNGMACRDESGEAEGEPLLAPLSRTPCLWYSYTVERAERTRGGQRWQMVERGNSRRPFLLDDTTGRCRVEPARADVTTLRRRRWLGEESRPLHRLLPLPVSGSYRYTESLIVEGDWLYVLGWFETPRAATFHEEAAAAQRRLLAEWKQDQEGLRRRFDRDGDGVISAEEWERARIAAAREAQRLTLQGEVMDAMPAISRSAVAGVPFLIAAEDPKQLATRYRWRAFATLVAGGCLSAVLASGLIL